MSRFDMLVFVIEMEFAVWMEEMFQLGFDESNFPVFVFGDVHRHALAVGFASNAKNDLRRWNRKRHDASSDVCFIRREILFEARCLLSQQILEE